MAHAGESVNLAAPGIDAGTIRLVPFGVDDITSRYLAWLADPEVNRYSVRRLAPSQDHAAARAWLEALQPDEQVLAIYDWQAGHVGNIKYGPIDWAARRADISILIGERSVWGHGIGRRAIYLLSKYLFTERKLKSVDAGTCNPAFVRSVLALGWKIKNIERAHIWLGDRMHDYTILEHSAINFVPKPEFEA